MRIVSLVASPNKHRGNTAGLLEFVLEGAGAEGAKTETFYLPGDTVLPCLACDTCHKKGRCFQKDEFENLKREIMKSDGLVLASPNYIFSVSAQMKAFMDRCSSVIHCLAFEGKYGASVVTSGGGDEPPIADYMNHFLMITGVKSVGSVWATMGEIYTDDFPREIRDRALALGGKLARCIRDREPFPEIEMKIASFKERMRSLMIYRKDEWPFEYDYWRKRRGLKEE